MTPIGEGMEPNEVFRREGRYRPYWSGRGKVIRVPPTAALLYEEYVLQGGIIVLVPSGGPRAPIANDLDLARENPDYPRCAEDILRDIKGARFLHPEDGVL